MARNRLSRWTRRALMLLGLGLLLLVALFLAADAGPDGSRLARHYPTVLLVSGVAVTLLCLVLLQQVIRLLRQRMRGEPGARLTTRLVVFFLVLSVPPAGVVYAFGLRFLHASIDSWFELPLKTALEDALEISRQSLEVRVRRAARQATTLAADLGDLGRDEHEARLELALEEFGADELSLISSDGRVLVSLAADPDLVVPEVPEDSTRLSAVQRGVYSEVEPIAGKLRIRALAALPASATPGERWLLQALVPIPATLAPHVARVEEQVHAYRNREFLRDSLKLGFSLILTFVVLLAIFIALIAAFSLSRRLVMPIAQLAAATREVAAGHYEGQLAEPADDELGFLVRSFNRMTRDLSLSQSRLRRSALETEAQRTFLASVLARLSSGVLTLDHEGRLRTANPAAGSILGIELERCAGLSLADLRREHPVLAGVLDCIARRQREGSREWREEVQLPRGEERQLLLLRGTQLPSTDAEDEGLLVVFDDLTVVQRAQRDAAWAEVARRLAHEIRNPLTPIQLSAERLRLKLLPRLGEEDARVLDRASHTIVAQVEAMKQMVSEFSEYARGGGLNLQSVNLHGLIEEVLELYSGEIRLNVQRDLDPALPGLRADPGRLRQLLHNLVRNALEAIPEPEPVQLSISTRMTHSTGGSRVIELCVADNGPGVPDELRARLFEPYVSSKPRGTGLGLAIVARIVEEHGGSIQADNRPQGGAEFRIRLPVR